MDEYLYMPPSSDRPPEETSEEAVADRLTPDRNRRAGTWKTVLILLAIFLSVISLTCGAFMAVRIARRTPEERTARALFSHYDRIQAFRKSGGSVHMDGMMSPDMLPFLKGQQKLNFEGDFAWKPYDGYTISGGFSVDQTGIMDLTVHENSEGTELSSYTLSGGDTYVFRQNGLSDKLKASLLSPGSGSPYAMSEEDFETLLSAVQMSGTDTPEGRVELHSPEEMRSHVQSLLQDGLIRTDTRETVTLSDGNIEADVAVYRVSDASLVRFLDFLSEEWRYNTAWHRAWKAALRLSLLDQSLEDGDMRTSEKRIQEEFLRIHSAVDEQLTAWKEAAEAKTLSLRITDAVNGKFLVSRTVTMEDSADGTATVLFFHCASDPKETKDWTLGLTRRENGQTIRQDTVDFRRTGTSRKNSTDTLVLTSETGETENRTKKTLSLVLEAATGKYRTLCVTKTTGEKTDFTMKASGILTVKKREIRWFIHHVEWESEGFCGGQGVSTDNMWANLEIHVGGPDQGVLKDGGQDPFGWNRETAEETIRSLREKEAGYRRTIEEWKKAVSGSVSG